MLITSPAAGTELSGIVAVKVDAPGVSRINFYVDGVLKGQDQAAPFVFNWYTKNYPDGQHTIKAVSGNGKYSVSATFSIKNATAPVTAPGFSTSLVANEDLNLPYNWTFDPGEASPTFAGYFWADGLLLQKITGPPPYHYVLDALVPGPHTLGHAWDSADSTHKTPPSSYSVKIHGISVTIAESNKTLIASVSCQ